MQVRIQELLLVGAISSFPSPPLFFPIISVANFPVLMIECLTQGLLSSHSNIYHSTTAYFFLSHPVYTSVIDSHIENSKIGTVNLVVVHFGVVTLCSTTKFTVPIFAVFDV